MEDFDSGQAEDVTLRLSVGSTGLPEIQEDQIAQSDLLVPGSLFLGKYNIQRRIGSGGMGVVYLCNQIFIGRDMAIKTLNQSSMSDEALQRFQTEAKAAGSLSHPNLVAVHDFGVTEGGTPYMVMDFVPGKTMQDVLSAHGQLPLEAVLDIFIECADGLAHAHEKGVYHRDIKPSNIVLLQEENIGPGSIRILDFGIAKIASNSAQTQELTKTGMVIGSPLYMSPEQSIGKKMDARTDIYSLGCVLFECLCGAPPFQGDSVIETLMLHQTEKPRTLQEASMGREFPVRLQELISAMMAKDVANRIDSMKSVHQELLRIREFVSGPDKPKKTVQEKNNKLKLSSSEDAQKAFSSIVQAVKTQLFSTPVIISAVALAVVGIAAFMISQLTPQEKPAPKINLADGRLATPEQVQASYDFKVKRALTESRSRGQDLVHVGNCDFSKSQFDLLGQQKWIRKLELVDSRQITPSGLETILNSNIETLSLYSSTLSDDCLIAISHCKSLKNLVLSRCKNVSHKGLIKIAEMKSLNNIDLTKLPVSDDVLIALLENNVNIWALNIGENPLITDNSMRIVARHKKQMGLDISNTFVSDEGLKHLGKNIIILVLNGDNRITDKGVETLIKNCPDLQVIQIPGTRITAKGVLMLAKLKKLTKLEIGQVDCDAATRDRIRNTFKAKNVETFGF